MYVNPYQNKLHLEEPDTVLAEQLKGWIYESHAWVVDSSENQHHKTCKWCGSTSKVDMVCDDPMETMCTKNPIIEAVLNTPCPVCVKAGEEGEDAEA